MVRSTVLIRGNCFVNMKIGKKKIVILHVIIMISIVKTLYML